MYALGFNLSILECKLILERSDFLGERSFNLSILECKLNAMIVNAVTVLVLIYPYWNVNQDR